MDREHDYTWLRSVRTAFRGRELVEPPDWVRHRAKQLFHSSPRSVLERVRAVLLFDSRGSGLAHAGVRSAAVLEGSWQLLYRGGDVDIDLLVRPNQDGRTTSLRGQALSLTGAHMAAGMVEALPTDSPRRLRDNRMPSARSELEPTGEFALWNLERGRYDVLVRFGVHEIELNGVEL
jgi:hypothetical protein